MDAYLYIMSAKQKFQSLRLASYNIRKARGLDGRRDPHRILEVINRLNADIIALQEADRRLGMRPSALPVELIARETDFQVQPFSKNDVSLGWHGNAVLLRKGLVARAHRRIELPGFEPRGAVGIELDVGRPLQVVATHLGLARRHRRQQMQKLSDQIRAGDASIIIGDFNEWSSKRGFEPLEPTFKVHSPGHSFHASQPVAALDRIALTQDIRLIDAGVEQGKLAQRASDHLPIWADVQVLPAAADASL